MGKQVQIKSGYTSVALPPYGLYDEGEIVVLTDAEYTALPEATTRALTLLSSPADPVRTDTSTLALQSSVDAVMRMAPVATGSDQTAALQAALNDATAKGQILALNGNHVISGQILVPSGAKIDGSLGSVTQTTDLTPAFRLTDAVGVRFRHVKANGKGSDYVNTSAVYGATAIYLAGACKDVRIDGGDLLGWAGGGVHLSTGCSDIAIRNCTMTGPGPTRITSTAYNYSGGIVVDPGVVRWSVIGCDISGFAQGVVTGDNLADVRILNNYIHDIPGQHGLYIETVNGCLIEGNLVRNCGLLGMKIQIGTTDAADPDTITIQGNIFINCGAQGILIDNPVGGAVRARRLNIVGNQVNTSAGVGIEVRYAVGARVADNIVYNTSAQGIRVMFSSAVTVEDNRINKTAFNGLDISDTTDWTVTNNRITDPASARNASAMFGMQILGSTTADGTLRQNKVTDSLGNMKYGIYMSAGDQTSVDFIDNFVTGATDYGVRLISGPVARSWRGNTVSGGLGSVLNPVPSQVVDPFGGPGLNGLLGANFDPALGVANMAAMAVGVLSLHKVVLPSGGSITKVVLALGAAGAGLVAGQNFVGIYDAAGNLLGQSADQSSSGFASTGNKIISLAAATAVLTPGSVIYVAILANGTTGPALRGISGTAIAVNVNLIASASRWATAGSGLTALPSTLPTMTASTVMQWVGVA